MLTVLGLLSGSREHPGKSNQRSSCGIRKGDGPVLQIVEVAERRAGFESADLGVGADVATALGVPGRFPAGHTRHSGTDGSGKRGKSGPCVGPQNRRGIARSARTPPAPRAEQKLAPGCLLTTGALAPGIVLG